MIFNTISQLTLPAAFSHDSPCPFQTTLKDLLSNSWIRRPTKRTFEPDTPTADAGQDVRPPSKRPKHTSVPQTDTNVELAVSQIPQVILPAAIPSALLDLPNELFDLILAHIPTSDLLSLTQQFHLRLRAVSARAYLKRINVLHNYNIIYLTGDVPAIAFQLLSAVRLFDHVSLVCNLYYFIEYGKELRDLAMTKARVRSLRINFHPNEKFLLNDPRTSASLVAFLTIVQESCHTLCLERQIRDPSNRRLTNAATCSTRQLRPLPARFILTGLSSLTISAFILRVPNLAAVCRALLQSPEVDTFQLDDCRSQRECDGVLAMSTFPVLKAITLRTVHNTAMYVKPAFFLRHSEIDSVSLYAYAIYGRSTPTPAPRSLFPLPRLSHLNVTANHYFRRLESSSRLRRCFLQTPNSFIQPESVEFCTNMNSLSTFISSLAQHHFEGLELAIQLPNSILYHTAHFQHSGNVCSCITPTGYQLLGVEKLEVEVDSFNTVVADNIYNWAKVCPNIVKLEVTHQLAEDNMDLTHIYDFVTHCGNALSMLTEMKCLAGVWKRQSGHWYMV